MKGSAPQSQWRLARWSRGGYSVIRPGFSEEQVDGSCSPLCSPPNAVTIRGIVEVLEGPADLVTCVNDPGTCERSVDCRAREICSEIEAKWVAAMPGVTLQDIVQRHKDRAARGGPNEVI